MMEKWCWLERYREVVRRVSEEEWGLLAFEREPLRGKIKMEQQVSLVRRALECGKAEAREAVCRWGKEKGEELLEEMVRGMDVRVGYDARENGGSPILFAQFVEPGEIIIYEDGICRMNDLMQEMDLSWLFPAGITLKQILLAHELFHRVECRKKDRIFTQTYRVELWRKPFSNRSPVACLSEIAGMAFAKELLHLPYLPFALDPLLLYLYHPESSAELLLLLKNS